MFFPPGMDLKHRKDYVVLHTFDEEGNHVDTKGWFAGFGSESNGELSSKKLREWVAELGEVDYHDIEVKLFQVTIDGVVFGLIPDEEDEENISIELMPSSTIAFFEPWNGTYDT